VWWVTFEAFTPVNIHNLVLSVFSFIYHVMYTLLISSFPVYTPLISYCFSFYACCSHLILSLLSLSALFLLHLVRSLLISYAFLTSNLLFCYLHFSAVFSSHLIPFFPFHVFSSLLTSSVPFSCLVYTHTLFISSLCFSLHLISYVLI
jgi:hypothetical protein